MSLPRLEEVFKLSGIPTYTFVRPLEYEKLLIALRTAGRGVVVEGPSGIGKTTAVTKALAELNVDAKATKLSARKKDDRDLIRELPEMRDAGVVIIDDFHRLEPAIQSSIADFMKTLADEEREDTKVVVVGINKVANSLISFAADLNTRIDIIRFEANPDERVMQLVDLGQSALNIALKVAPEIVTAAAGSFFIAQMLCREACIAAHITEAQELRKDVNISVETITYRVMAELSRAFLPIAMTFAAGPRLRREGRAPYLHILKWLAEANEWSIALDRELAKHPEQRGSVGQVVEKGYLLDFLGKNESFADVLHYQASTSILTVEDPQFVFFLRHLGWNKFASQVGYLSIDFRSRYDFALSFAGPDRGFARELFGLLSDDELSVFFDENEQSRILAENIEDYLGPIYASEATYVVCFLGPEYPKRIWTVFESKQFKDRFGEGAVIPIWFTTAPPGVFDESSRVGGITLDPTSDTHVQLRAMAELLCRKILERAVGQGRA